MSDPLSDLESAIDSRCDCTGGPECRRCKRERAALAAIRARLAEVDRAEWATGLCSAHQRPDPLCRLCNPALAAAEAVAQREAGEVARMRDRAQQSEAREAALRKALEGLARLYDTDEGCRSTPEYVAARAALKVPRAK